MDDLIPLTESEMLKWPVIVKVCKKYTSLGTAYYSWICFCGRECKIACSTSARGGNCQCNRDWNLDRIAMTAIVIEPITHPDYKFPIIVDRGSSWRFIRRPSVGLR